MKKINKYKIEPWDFPTEANDMPTRVVSILTKVVDSKWLGSMDLKYDDGYFYTRINFSFNRFDSLFDLKDYVFIWWFITKNNPDDILEILKRTNLDLSFDNNILYQISYDGRFRKVGEKIYKEETIRKGYEELVNFLKTHKKPDGQYSD